MKDSKQLQKTIFFSKLKDIYSIIGHIIISYVFIIQGDYDAREIPFKIVFDSNLVIVPFTKINFYFWNWYTYIHKRNKGIERGFPLWILVPKKPNQIKNSKWEANTLFFPSENYLRTPVFF